MSTPGVAPSINPDKGIQSKKQFLTYGWTIAQNLFYLWLIYLAFGKMTSVFETLILALLILIYESVSSYAAIILRTFIEESHIVRSLFLVVFKKFEDPTVAEGEAGLNAIIAEYHSRTPVFYINSVRNTIVYVYVVCKIIQVLVLA